VFFKQRFTHAFFTAADLAAMDDKYPTMAILRQSPTHPSVYAAQGEIDFTSDGYRRRPGRLPHSEGMTAPVPGYLFVIHPYPETARPEDSCTECSPGVSQIDMEFIINKGAEAFNELPPVLFNGRLVLKDFQHHHFL
jgi:hypothetical protein